MDEIKVGDVVVLKSGGPDMTVVEVQGEEVVCQWFAKKEVVESGKFSQSSLDKKESNWTTGAANLPR
jgi:uncharacterized protein YodC (DUF2158 family)